MGRSCSWLERRGVLVATPIVARVIAVPDDLEISDLRRREGLWPGGLPVNL